MVDEEVKIGSNIKLLTVILGIVGVILSIGISWGVSQSKVATLEERFNTMKVEHKIEVSKLQEELFKVRIQQAANEEWKKNVISSLDEIKGVVKSIKDSINNKNR